MRTPVVGILGGGLSGLSLAYLYDRPAAILEMQERVGGHCRSHEKDGFRYDEGGHILFSRKPEILQQMLALLGDNVVRHYRNNKIWYKGRFVRYPFENGLADLDPEDRFECLYHYVNNTFPEPNNFGEWIYHTFGKGIAERYLIPYNRKIWKRDPATIGLDWVGGRVPKPPLADIIKAAVGVTTEGYVHQLFFYYPRTGGFESLVRALEDKARRNTEIETGFRVTQVGRERDRWIVSDGSRERAFDKLVSTIPVLNLLTALDDVPEDVMEAARALSYNRNLFVLVGLTDCAAKDQVAVYFPQEDVVFHRACFYHVYGGDSVPPGKFSLCVEISASGEEGLWSMSDSQVVERVLADLSREGFIRTSDVIATDVHRVEHSYVVYDLDYARNSRIVKDYVKSTGIALLGRFAEFEYLNTDQCFERAIVLAKKLQHDHP